MKMLQLLIKMGFFNKINNFMLFNIIKYIFNGRSDKVFISYIFKINTFNQNVNTESRRDRPVFCL